eukprot:CAMPEP_0184971216 /NCGR_PEP_ID=MMETSP1098-20130426/3474_1 /TAXON_ID=89044 /ORGANISM="Spumella elongata, Strain CCAP 955/1" /LENGTH=187 /DNA_ID=CAMNT_0027493285 /DNA_START=34 /DNA_END=597 /DNA_ORIENTATION=+
MNSGLLLSRWGRKLGKRLMKPRLSPMPEEDPRRWNIVRGDLVEVIQGHSLGQKGKVLSVIRDSARIVVDGVNMRSRNIKPKQDGTPGKKIMRPSALHYSNVMLIDPTTGKPTKTSRRFLEDGTKVRVSKATGQVIPKPDPLVDRNPRSVVVGSKDTAPADVFQVTFLDYAKYLPYIYATENAASELD